MADLLLQNAVKHFASRYEANGVVPSDFQAMAATMDSWDQWCGVWSRWAAVHEELGRRALESGAGFSAGEHLARAAVYYHFGKYLFVKDMDQLRAAHRKAVECHTLALPLLDPPGERVLVPYEGMKLAGVLRRPRGVDAPAVAILLLGLDSAKEEMDGFSKHFLDRGLATLVVDGPGQGEAEYETPIRWDYENVVGPMIDWLETRTDVDARRVGVWGISLGGYYAPRAAAFDARVKACVAIGGPYDMSASWDGKPFLSREVFRVRSHSSSDAEAKEKASKLCLKGVAEKIVCPLFVVGGSLDTLCAPEEQRRLASEAKGETRLTIVEGGNHVCHNKPYAYRPQTADWLAQKLGART